ncbi:MAG: hypothetical protein NZL83_03650 [Candidatus Absconditabacterales bacterium]|nr:hypothetical protein [Candidatus Absconditabacterales bacterium]
MALFEEVLGRSSYEQHNNNHDVRASFETNHDAQDVFKKNAEYQQHILDAEREMDAQEGLSDIKVSDAHDHLFIEYLYVSRPPIFSGGPQLGPTGCERLTKSPREDIVSDIVDFGISTSYSLTSPGQTVPYLVLGPEDLALIRSGGVECAKKLFFEKINLDHYHEQTV